MTEDTYRDVIGLIVIILIKVLLVINVRQSGALATIAKELQPLATPNNLNPLSEGGVSPPESRN